MTSKSPSNTEMIGRLIVSISIFACIYQLTMYAIGSPDAFNYLERSETTNLFPDLRIWTHNAASCNIHPWQLKGSNQCSEGPLFNYPWFPIALLKVMGVKEAHNTALGYFTGITTILTCLVYKIWKKKNAPPKARVWIDISFGIFILSRPMLYALERGQPDLLILIGIIAICGIYERENLAKQQTHTRNLLIVPGILALLTITKLYPVIGLLASFFCSSAALRNEDRRNGAKKRHLLIIGYTLLLLGIAAACLEPYLLTRAYNIQNLGNHGFGLQVQAGAHVASQLLFKTIIAVASCILGCSLLISKRKAPTNTSTDTYEIQVNDGELCALVVTSTIAVGIYLLTENIYYKLILLYPVFLWSAKSLAAADRSRRRDFGVMIFCAILAVFTIQLMPYESAIQADKENLLHLLIYPSLFGGLASFPALMALSPSTLIREFQRNHKKPPNRF